MDAAENKVAGWLRKYGLDARRYSKADLRSGRKTPDFRVFSTESERFLCEVKAVMPGKSISPESDPIPNRLTDDIHDAYGKFFASNPAHGFPNVLAFVECDIASGVDYLEDVLLGKWFLEGTSGSTMPFYAKYAEGRIKDEKTVVDLYLWLSDDTVYFRFTGVKPSHFATLCGLFNIDERTVPKIGG